MKRKQCKHIDNLDRSPEVDETFVGDWSSPEHVSGARAAYFPLPAETYFCDSRSPLRSQLRDLPLCSRSSDYFYMRSSIRFRSLGFPPALLRFPLQCFKKQTMVCLKKYTAIWPTVGKASAIFNPSMRASVRL